MSVESRAMLELNIIYTRDTPALLAPLAWGFLHESVGRITLWSNGCSEADRQVLGVLPGLDERFRLRDLGDTVVDHGSALNRVFMDDGPDRFIVVDSDIFAADDRWLRLVDRLDEAEYVSSGLPVWQGGGEPKAGRSGGFGGRRWHAPNGRCLGATYFMALCRSAVLRMQQTHGIGFERARFEALAPELQAYLQDQDLAVERYDTAKLLGCLLETELDDMPECLVHLGGVSVYRARPRAAAENNPARPREAEVRAVSEYFGSLLQALNARSDSRPALPDLGRPDIERVVSASERLHGYYAHHLARGRGFDVLLRACV